MFPCISTSISDVCGSMWIFLDEGGGDAQQAEVKQMLCRNVLKSSVKKCVCLRRSKENAEDSTLPICPSACFILGKYLVHVHMNLGASSS